jgi:deazaflavin-dependent oxidoreductase (nitroreductase family)
MRRFNKRVTNRVQGLWAPYLPPWAKIVHKGRKSGREFETPVLAKKSGQRLEIVLFYGEDTDWVRNVLAADGAGVRRAGRASTLSHVRVVDSTDPDVSPAVRRIARGKLRVLVGDLTD